MLAVATLVASELLFRWTNGDRRIGRFPYLCMDFAFSVKTARFKLGLFGFNLFGEEKFYVILM